MSGDWWATPLVDPPSGVKVLLDEMYAPALAQALRERGHDVLSADEVGLSGADDERLFEAAQAERRAVATENVSDYLELDARYRSLGRVHRGLLLVHPGTLNRHHRSFAGQFVGAMDKLLLSLRGKRLAPSWTHWLRPGR